MTFVEVIEEVSRATGIPKTKVRAVLTAFFAVVRDVTAQGEPVKVSGFGRFFRRTLNPRKYFGGDKKPARSRLGFGPSEKLMEKYGVEYDNDLEKQGTQQDKDTCPECGRKLDGPNHCPKCGTKPFEKPARKEK